MRTLGQEPGKASWALLEDVAHDPAAYKTPRYGEDAEAQSTRATLPSAALALAATLPTEALVLELQAQPGLGDRLTRSTGRVTREEKTQAGPPTSVSWTLGPGSGPTGGEAPGLVKVALPVNT